MRLTRNYSAGKRADNQEWVHGEDPGRHTSTMLAPVIEGMQRSSENIRVIDTKPLELEEQVVLQDPDYQNCTAVHVEENLQCFDQPWTSARYAIDLNTVHEQSNGDPVTSEKERLDWVVERVQELGRHQGESDRNDQGEGSEECNVQEEEDFANNHQTVELVRSVSNHYREGSGGHGASKPRPGEVGHAIFPSYGFRGLVVLVLMLGAFLIFLVVARCVAMADGRNRVGHVQQV